MESTNDFNNTLDTESNKRIARRPLCFFDSGKRVIFTLEQEIIDKLKLTRNDLWTQEVHGEDIVLKRFRSSPT